MLSPRFPYPPHKGDQAIVYHRLRTLGRKHNITLLCMHERASELERMQEATEFCRLIPIHHPKWRSYVDIVGTGLLSSDPLQVIYYRSSAFRRELRKVLAEGAFDLVHGVTLRTLPYVAASGLPAIVELVDSQIVNLKRRLEHERSVLNPVLREELRRVQRYEPGVPSVARHVVVVSQIDRQEFPDHNVHVIPLGIQTEVFANQGTSKQKPTIVFSGNMHYPPNVDAVTWLMENCFALMREKVADITFLIAGKDPLPSVTRFASTDGVVITGFVESMPALLNRAMVSVAPMRMGSGMQFKILEAMSCGLPVVTTTVGRGDIRATPEDGLFVADTPNDFTATTVQLLQDPDFRARLGAKARAFVIANHSWEKAAEWIEALYADIVSAHRCARRCRGQAQHWGDRL